MCILRIELPANHISDISNDILSVLSGLFDSQLLIASRHQADILPLSQVVGRRSNHFLFVFASECVLTVMVRQHFFVFLFIIVFLLFVFLEQQVRVLEPSRAILSQLLHLNQPIIITTKKSGKLSLTSRLDHLSSTNTIKASHLLQHIHFLLFT